MTYREESNNIILNREDYFKFMGELSDKDIRNMFIAFTVDIFKLEDELNKKFCEVTIPRSTEIGIYIVTHLDKEVVEDNEERRITTKNIADALLIALHTNNDKVAQELLIMFHELASGTRDELLEKYPRDKEIIDFIISCAGKTYLDYVQEEEDKEISKGR